MSGDGNGTINNYGSTINTNNTNALTAMDSTLISIDGNEPIDRTPFYLKEGETIGEDLAQQTQNIQLKNGQCYDHNFLLNKRKVGRMSLVTSAIAPVNGM